jgi:hypothetical protein
MATTWTIAIDWDRNGNYSGTYDDVTSRVIEAQWMLGMTEPYQDVAENSTLTLLLDNSDKRYSPENTGSPITGKVVPFRPVRIQSNDGSTTRTHWLGWIDTIQPDVGKFGERRVRLSAVGPMQFFKAAETALALQENRRTDQIIADLLKEVVIPPALNRAWVLGRVGNSELGTTTYLADTTAYSTLETGILTLVLGGDNWVRQGGLSDVQKNTFDVSHAIRDVTAAERGRFFIDREGKAVFWNRHHLLQGASVAATLDDAMTEMQYTFAGVDQCKNEVIVICHPRTVSSSANDILWQLGDAIIRVEAGQTRTLYVKYEDENGKCIGAKEVTVGDLAFDAGTATAAVKAQANGAELTFTNNGAAAAIITQCIVRGRKISDAGEMEAKAVDASSTIDYGRRTLRLNLPSIESLEGAQYIADFERNRRGQPRGEVLSMKVASHGKNGGGQHAQQLAQVIGDLLRVKETQSAHDKNYHLIGEMHKLTEGATLFETTWYLEPAPTTLPWKLGAVGRGELGTNTRLAY